MDKALQREMQKVMNRLAKWRSVFAGWQLGTRQLGDPESDAVRDHREVTILLRAEVTALTWVLVEKGVFTWDEYVRALIRESDELSKMYEAKFPGMKATDLGIQYDERASETMRGWRP